VFPEIPGFKIIELIGEGAMARVFLAIDDALDRKVALKVMNQSLAHDPTFRDRFLAEAKDTAKFIHPGIVSIYSTGVQNDNYYLVLEYIESGTLKERQRARLQFSRENERETDPLFSTQESLVLLAQLADALSYAHSKKVIHRDIKPANIMFRSNGQAVLTDFGIAKSVTENRELTLTGYSVGTPAYMSPEQKLGADIDICSDLYSVGVVFYELLTGYKPYQTGTGNYADLRRELDADVPELPTGLSYLQPMLDKLLAKDPDDRYQSASELLDVIEQVSGSSTAASSDATVIQRSKRPSVKAKLSGKIRFSRKTQLIIGSTAILMAAASTATWLFLPEPVPEVVTVDAETAQKIEGLLGTADIFLQMGDLIDAGPSNAVDVYSRVLGMQAGNPKALVGMQSALEQILMQIETDIETGDLKAARNLIQLSEHYFPDDENLADLRAQAGL
jgi:serine/threonine-protein kinase PpkA